MRFMAWDALFKGPPFFARLITAWGAFPVDPEGTDPGGFRTCLKLLKAGERVLIFPEGGRSYDGRLQPMREGVARLAMRAEVPIAPVRLTGGQMAWPRGDFAPRPFFPIHVRFCPAIHPRPARAPDERHAESARLMQALTAALRSRDAVSFYD